MNELISLLADVTDAARFGAKAVRLGCLIRAGAPVPPRICLFGRCISG